MYMVFGVMAGIVGMTYSVMMRMELIGGSEQIMGGQVYNVVITYHGIVMLFYVGMAVIIRRVWKYNGG
jgi:cytochrome c oxidase subunit I